MGGRILIIEASRYWRSTLEFSLTAAGFVVDAAPDGDAALARLRTTPYILILLDLMQGAKEGLAICRAIRHTRTLPIVMLATRSDEADRLAAFAAGADDFLTAPVNVDEVRARIRAVLRRFPHDRVVGREVLHVGDLRIDLERHALHIGEARVNLRAKEFALLVALARRPGATQSRESLLREVWGHMQPVETRTVDVHIKTLRQRLADAEIQIETVWGVGYRLVA